MAWMKLHIWLYGIAWLLVGISFGIANAEYEYLKWPFVLIGAGLMIFVHVKYKGALYK